MEKLKMAILDKIENLDVTTLSLDELESLLMHYLTPGYIDKEEDTKVKRLTL